MRSPRPFPLAPFAPDALAAGSGFLVFLGLATVVSFLANRHWTEAARPQPVQFDHRLHVEDEGLDCSMCHVGYETGPHSGLPTAQMCALCHSEPQGETAEEAKLVRLIEEGAPLEWESVFRQPPHVFFSHSRHVVVAGLECATCHGDIATSERPPREKRPLTMHTCIACHERESVSTSCTKCHR